MSAQVQKPFYDKINFPLSIVTFNNNLWIISYFQFLTNLKKKPDLFNECFSQRMYTIANDSTLTPLLVNKTHANKAHGHNETIVRILKLCKSNLSCNTFMDVFEEDKSNSSLLKWWLTCAKELSSCAFFTNLQKNIWKISI